MDVSSTADLSCIAPDSIQMRRLPERTANQAMAPKPETSERQASAGAAASSSDTHDAEAKLWDNIPVPSVADPFEQQIMTPKTLLDCCRCSQEFVTECDLKMDWILDSSMSCEP